MYMYNCVIAVMHFLKRQVISCVSLVDDSMLHHPLPGSQMHTVAILRQHYIQVNTLVLHLLSVQEVTI